jgi:putative transposase
VGVIRYPDRGSQYTALDLALAAAMYGLRRSIGSTGICILTGAERRRN